MAAGSAAGVERVPFARSFTPNAGRAARGQDGDEWGDDWHHRGQAPELLGGGEREGGGRRNGRGKTLPETTRRGTNLGTREEKEMKRKGLPRWAKGMAVTPCGAGVTCRCAWGIKP